VISILSMLKQNTQRRWEYEKTTNRVAEINKRNFPNYLIYG